MSFKKYNSNFRNFVVGLDTKIPLGDGLDVWGGMNMNMVTAINFDNAATTPPFITVMQEIINFAPWYSSVHRGTGYKSELSSKLFEESRLDVLNFVNADPENDIAIFVKNATEAINKLSFRLCDKNKDCVVLSTFMEHHSNDLPWRDKYIVDYIDIDINGRLCLEDLESKLIKYKGKVKLITITGASNVTGYINPVHKAAAIAHKYNAKICVDGAQLIPHMQFNMKPHDAQQHIDYLVFSAHKMYAPFGIGVLIAPRDLFTHGCPDYAGGGTVKVVTHDYIKWEDPPHKEEAGTPNIIGVQALSASIKTFNLIGLKNIEKYEHSLLKYTLQKLKNIPGLILYGNTKEGMDQVGIIPFNIAGVYHGIVSSILSCEAGIAVRSGCFCAQPYIQRLLNINREEIEKSIENPDSPRPGMVRISFGLYNNYAEIDKLVWILESIAENKDNYLKKYKRNMK